MAKGRSMKDLKDISHLFTQNKPEAPFAQQLAAHDAEPPPVEDIEVAILGLMTNYRGWTVGDVQRVLKAHPDVAQIPSIMNKFANEGKFEITHTTGRANMYQLKRTPYETITSARNAASKPWKHQDPAGTRQAPDPKGVILLEEGLDIAIWKIMSDGKWYTTPEVTLLVQAGNPDLNANSISATLSKLWQQEIVERQAIEGVRYFNYRLIEGKPMPENNSMGGRFSKAQREELENAVPQKDPRQQELPGVAAEAQTPEAKRADELVHEIIARREGKVAAQPTTETNKEDNTMANAATSLVQVKNASTEVKVPLVEFVIPIKGEKFTFDECRQLIKELTALGYGKNFATSAVSGLALVKQDVTIKGIDFTPAELSELLAKFDEAGFSLIRK